MQMQGSFDASQFKPQQGFDKVMPGRYPFQITNTEIVATKDNSGGMFVVTFQTPAGTIQSRYNLWNSSPKAVEIAHGQLSALCHATGIFRLNWQTEGAELRGGIGQIDVGFQNGQEPTPDKPEGGYTEIKRIYDKDGIEPGKQKPSPAPQMQPQPSAPMTSQQGGGWGAPNQQAPQAPQQANAPAWGAASNPMPQQGQTGQTQSAPWTQGPSGQGTPPWAK